MNFQSGSLPRASDSRQSDPLTSRIPFFYGWVILPVAAMAQILTAPGQTLGVSLFNPYFKSDLGLTASQVAGAYMFGTLLAALPQTYVGAMMDRYGARRTMAGVVVLLAFSCFAVSQISGLTTLFLGFFLLRLLGQGALSLTASNTMAMWFQKKMGTASGIKSVLMGVAYAYVPGWILLLIQTFGWRQSYTIMGLVVLVVMLPLIAILHRNRPEDVGQLPDGEVPGPDDTSPPNGKQKPDAPHEPSKTTTKDPEPCFTLHEAMHTPAYWIMLLGNGFWAMTGTTVVFHIVSISESQGLSNDDAVEALKTFWTLFAILQLVGGLLADRLPLNILLSIGMGLVATGLAVMINATTPDGARLATGILGASQGVIGAVGATMWVRYFGRMHLGKIRGSAGSAMVGFSAIGPFLFTTIAAYQDKLLSGLWFFLIPFAALSVIALFLRKPEFGVEVKGS